MLKNRIFSSAIVIAGGLFATTAVADMHADKHKEKQDTVSFEKVDENGDGYISQNEFVNSGAFQVDHEKLDTDQDGRVNQSEFAAFERTEMQGQGQQSQQGLGQPDESEYDDQNPEFESDYTTDPAEDPTQADSDY